MNPSTQHAFNSEEVMAYLDGELEPQRAAALAEHLAHCRECEALAAQFRNVAVRLLEFQIESVPSELNATVLRALETDIGTEIGAKSGAVEKRRKWRPRVASPYTWAFACLLIVALILKLGLPNLMNLGGGAFTTTGRIAKSRSIDTANTAFSPYMSEMRAVPNAKAMIAGGGGDAESGAIEAPAPTGPMIAQTASLTIVASNYNEASASVDRLAASQGGYVQKLATEDQLAAAREFSATVRVPAAQLGGFLAELRKLGHVEQETRTNEEVTDQYVDLQARLKSARASEQRMLELLATRTGKLEDVLDAERELARIREEIESMERQRILLAHRVNYATVEIQLREVYREKLDSRSTSTATKIWNAAVEGYGNLEDGAIGMLLFLLAYGPEILFWLAIVLLPGWIIWRWRRWRR
jgi:hypothetical protein